MTLNHHFPKKVLRLNLGIAVAFLLLLVGLFAPIITLNKLIVVSNTFSLVSGTFELVREGHYFIFFIVLAFSIALPILKLALLARFLNIEIDQNHKLKNYIHWIHVYGKWSMLDVFVVAILVVSVKLGALANVELHYGFYAFAGSVLITMVVTAMVTKLADLYTLQKSDISN